MPFVAAGLASALVLYGHNEYGSASYPSTLFRITFLALIPLILLLGLWLSIKSIPLIPERGDKDYAYSGLVLNLFFILLYVFCLITIAYFLPKLH